MKIQVTLVDGSEAEVERADALELLPYQIVYHSPLLKPPLQGVICHRGQLVPVLGAVAESAEPGLPPESRPWILLLRGSAIAIQGYPRFPDDCDAHAPELRLLESLEEETKRAA